jgi:hypothetical protein
MPRARAGDVVLRWLLGLVHGLTNIRFWRHSPRARQRPRGRHRWRCFSLLYQYLIGLARVACTAIGRRDS